MKGDSRWVTALHYAFQDEEYLVRILGNVGGGLPGDIEKALGCQRPWVQGERERDPSWDQQTCPLHQLEGLEPPA